MSDVVYMVRARTEAACKRELARICERMDAEVATDPTDAAGRHWVARAVPRKTKAFAVTGGESERPASSEEKSG
jgi:hypothetical protein